MKYTRRNVWIIFLGIITAIILLIYYSIPDTGRYKSSEPITDAIVKEVYPDLYSALSSRNAGALKPFLTHENQIIREQAWRILISTPIDSLAPFIELAKQQNSEVAWFAISRHRLNQNQLRELEEKWDKSGTFQKEIAQVLGQQGDRKSLDFLLSKPADNEETEYQMALAVSRLIQRLDTDENQQIKILQQAFAADNEPASRAYLYGWYRGAASALTEVAKDTLHNRWQVRGIGISPGIDQFVNNILPNRTTHTMAVYYNAKQMLENDIQLAVELAKSLDNINVGRKSEQVAKILLANSNPLVKMQTLQSLTGKIAKNDYLYNYLNRYLVADSTLTDAVWLDALLTIVPLDSTFAIEYEDRLKRIADDKKYLLPKVLAIYRQTQPPEHYLKQIEALINQEKPLSRMFALQGVNNYWQNLQEEEKTQEHINRLRELTFQALNFHDRGTTWMAQPLLLNKELFKTDDFDRINSTLSDFSLPDDIEVYQAFGSLYKKRFEGQARPFIDSLAALKYAPLNRSLVDVGWDIDLPEKNQTEFRMPNWQRLWELGRKPVWVLRTEKGVIEIELNTLSAPATISAIDSLDRAGAYEGVPFHRVVPNFVIQGGDIERKDGFGGPDFLIPTEASEQGFRRGVVGIASAGIDTEGSQYFIMHQWSPHLNGNHTRFGKVIKGMQVVDRIVMGDKVLSTGWY